MKTLAIISRKGGAGKTTIALHLAVAAEAQGIATAIFDLDPQASASLWSDHRGESIPAVIPAQSPRLPALLSQAKEQQADLVILDTAPHADGIASDAAVHADLILIPCRPSALDLDAIGASIRLARTTEKPAIVIINAAPSQGVETNEAIEAIQKAGVEVCPIVLHQRKSYASRIHEGRTATEIEPKGKAADETRALLSWICERLKLLPK
ncbi:MAG: ParA family protein [Methylococcaceae bacterium]